MVNKVAIVLVGLEVMIKSLTLASFTVEPISVTPPESLIKDHGNGTYTIAEGAAVRLICKLTYAPGSTWFLKWTHPADTIKHKQTAHWDGCEDEDFVTRDIHITKIQHSDSGSYRCHQKKRGRGNSWDDVAPYTINITVGGQMEKRNSNTNNDILTGNTDPPREITTMDSVETTDTICNNDVLIQEIAELKDEIAELKDRILGATPEPTK